MPDPLNSLIDGVQKTRRLQLSRLLILGILSVLGIWCLCFLSYAAADIYFKLSSFGRTFALLATIVAVLLAVSKLWLRPITHKPSDPEVAVGIEAQHPEVETALSTSLEYGEDPVKTEQMSSPAIVGQLIEQASSRTEHFKFEETVDWRLAKWLVVPILIVAVAVAGGFYAAPTLFWPSLQRFLIPWIKVDPPTLARVVKVTPGNIEIPYRGSVNLSAKVIGFLPKTASLHYKPLDDEWREEEMMARKGGEYAFALRDVKKDFKYFIEARDHHSLPFTVTVYVEPVIERLGATLTYPKYTGVPPRTIDRKLAGIRALRGTKVELDVVTNVPVKKAELLFKSGFQLELKTVETNRLTGSFILEEDDHYAVKLYDRRGRSNANLSWNSIKALEDQKPGIRITSPDPDLMVAEDQDVTIKMMADDDFGIEEMGLAWYVLGEDEVRETVKELDPPLKKTRGRHSLDLDAMVLPPGAILAYYAYAVDNDEITGPKEAVSILHFLRVYEEEKLATEDKMENEEEKKKEQARQEMMADLEKMIGEQIKVVASTFRLANTGRKERTKPQRENMKGMGKKEKKLAGQVENLADTLEAALQEQGVTEVPEVEALREAISPMQDASWFLEYEEPEDALDPSKAGLHALSKARKLIKKMSNEQGRKAAYMMAMQQQKSKRRQQRQDRSEELQKMAKEMPKMLERQEKVKRELEQLTKEQEENRERDEQRQPDTPEMAQKREEVKDELDDLLNEAFDMARQMAAQAEADSQMSRRASERMNEATNDIFQTQRNVQEQEYQSALEKARESERKMREAERSLHNAMRRDLADAMKAAAERTEQLAERQEKLKQETRRQAQQPQNSQPSQSQPQGQNQQMAQADAQQPQSSQGPQEPKPEQQQAPSQKSQQQSQRQEAQKSQQQAQSQQGQQAQGKQSQQQARDQEAQQEAQGQKSQQQAQSQQGQQAQGKQSQQQARGQEAQEQTQSREGQKSQQQASASGAPRQQKPGEQERQARAQGRQADRQQAPGMLPEETPSPSAQDSRRTTPDSSILTAKQQVLRQDAQALGEDIEELAERAANSGRSQDNRDLQEVAKSLKEGKAPEEMRKARRELDAGQFSAATPHQEEAARELKNAQSRLNQAVARAQGEDDEKLAQMLQATERLAEEQRQINRKASRGENREELPSRQNKAARQTGQLAKQSRQLGPLADAGLDEQTSRSFQAAARQMKENTKSLETPSKDFDPSQGKEAVRQLEAAAENLRLARQRSMANQIKQAAEMAKAAAEQERGVEDMLRTAAEGLKPQQTVPQVQQRSIARTQDQAANTAREMEKAVGRLERLAEKTKSWVAEDLKQAQSALQQQKVVPQMERLAQQLSPSGKPMNARAAKAQQPQADTLAQSLEGVQRKLEDVHDDFLATPLEKLQKAGQQVSKTIEKLEKLDDTAKKLAKAPSQEQEAAARELSKETENAKQEVKNLRNQVRRTGSQTPATRESLQKAEAEMDSAQEALSSKESDRASGRFTAAREHLQVARESILERIKRILRKRDIKEPGSENIPAEYRDLVKKYYQVLSEEK